MQLYDIVPITFALASTVGAYPLISNLSALSTIEIVMCLGIVIGSLWLSIMAWSVR